MEKRPQTIENVITGIPEEEPVDLSRLTSAVRVLWALLKFCAELYGIGCAEKMQSAAAQMRSRAFTFLPPFKLLSYWSQIDIIGFNLMNCTLP